MDEIRALAEPLAGARCSSCPRPLRSGVAENPVTLVQLMHDAGLEASGASFAVRMSSSPATKTIHNALQGNPQGLTTSSARAPAFRS